MCLVSRLQVTKTEEIIVVKNIYWVLNFCVVGVSEKKRIKVKKYTSFEILERSDNYPNQK